MKKAVKERLTRGTDDDWSVIVVLECKHEIKFRGTRRDRLDHAYALYAPEFKCPTCSEASMKKPTITGIRVGLSNARKLLTIGEQRFTAAVTEMKEARDDLEHRRELVRIYERDLAAAEIRREKRLQARRDAAKARRNKLNQEQ
jgi:hypothetical protein